MNWKSTNLDRANFEIKNNSLKMNKLQISLMVLAILLVAFAIVTTEAMVSIAIAIFKKRFPIIFITFLSEICFQLQSLIWFYNFFIFLFYVFSSLFFLLICLLFSLVQTKECCLLAFFPKTTLLFRCLLNAFQRQWYLPLRRNNAEKNNLVRN